MQETCSATLSFIILIGCVVAMNRFAEDSHLLPVASGITKSKWYLKANCCIRSKTACLILMWNFAVLLVYMAFNVGNHFRYHSKYHTAVMVSIGVSAVAVFAPMAGVLTDLKYSRYKTVTCSSYFLLIVVLTAVCYFIHIKLKFYNISGVYEALGIIFAGMLLVTSLVLMINLIQFGMDQLHDSPTEHSILFIHWYVWVYYLSSFITGLSSNFLLNYNSTVSDTVVLMEAILCLSIVTFSL